MVNVAIVVVLPLPFNDHDRVPDDTWSPEVNQESLPEANAAGAPEICSMSVPDTVTDVVPLVTVLGE